MKFALQIINEHLFIELRDGLYLIDTGSAGSFSDSREIAISPETVFSVADNFLKVNSSLINKYVECKCSGLLGANLLSKFILGINMLDSCLYLEECNSESFVKTDFLESTFEFRQSLILCSFEVADMQLPLFVDTGAPMSYLPIDFENGKPGKTIKDFHPFIGSFESQSRLCEIQLGNDKYEWEFGLMPELLNRAVLSAGGKGLMGLDLFRSYEVWVDYHSSKMYLRKF